MHGVLSLMIGLRTPSCSSNLRNVWQVPYNAYLSTFHFLLDPFSPWDLPHTPRRLAVLATVGPLPCSSATDTTPAMSLSDVDQDW